MYSIFLSAYFSMLIGVRSAGLYLRRITTMKGISRFVAKGLFAVAAACSLFAPAYAENTNVKDIRKLSQHFTDSNSYSPWMFYPEDNITSLSSKERPGYVTIRHAGKGEDIKAILKDPIKIDEYPIPW